MENYVHKITNIHGDVFYYNRKYDFHRLDGPAVEYHNGAKEWWVNGKHHRIAGPSVEWWNGEKLWHIKGKGHPKSCHNRLVLFFVLERRRIDLKPMGE